MRLGRALERERRQQKPQYREMCRRFIADDDDFSEENMKRCGIDRHFVNDNLAKDNMEFATFKTYIKENA